MKIGTCELKWNVFLGAGIVVALILSTRAQEAATPTKTEDKALVVVNGKELTTTDADGKVAQWLDALGDRVPPEQSDDRRCEGVPLGSGRDSTSQFRIGPMHCTRNAPSSTLVQMGQP